MKKLLLGVALLLIGSNAIAEWEYKKHFDEMRGSESYTASLQSMPINKDIDNELLLLLSSDNNSTSSLAGLHLLSGRFDCDNPNLCKIAVRYGNGAVKSVFVRLNDERNLAFFINSNEVAETLRLSDVMYVEIPIFRKGSAQYKYDTSGFKWTGIEKTGEYLTSLGSIDFTKELPNIPSNTYKNDRGSVCYDINDFSFGIKVKAVGKASVCIEGKFPIYVEVSNVKVNKNDFVKEVNLARKADEDTEGNTHMWLASDDEFLTMILLTKPNKNGYEIFMDYSPRINIYSQK
ncbi:hypothetical protein [Proteus mirabilis]|uniref:hypothetical protein n=1 Tax=Proteus mirabilis TaxID=584 RepID=UPI0034D3D9F0